LDCHGYSPCGPLALRKSAVNLVFAGFKLKNKKDAEGSIGSNLSVKLNQQRCGYVLSPAPRRVQEEGSRGTYFFFAPFDFAFAAGLALFETIFLAMGNTPSSELTVDELR
jgi:hypothetical protein